jgi:hypothetical protein
MIVKTLLLAPDCKLTDEELMRDNQTIANPTNKKFKHELSETITEHSFESLDIKTERVSSITPSTRVLRSKSSVQQVKKEEPDIEANLTREIT